MDKLPEADLWCGGFPCQDISNAGKRTGIRGSRSGLFFDWMRAVRMVRPKYMLVENVAALLHRGMGEVCGELAESGYDAEWDCIPAAAVGAPHRRDRVFIHGALCSDPDQQRLKQDAELRQELQRADYSRNSGAEDKDLLADPQRDETVPKHNKSSEPREQQGRTAQAGTKTLRQTNRQAGADCSCGHGETVAHAPSERSDTRRAERTGQQRATSLVEYCGTIGRDQWATEPDVGRVANGVPSRVDRLRCLGNAVVPQVAEYIGRLLAEAASAD